MPWSGKLGLKRWSQKWHIANMHNYMEVLPPPPPSRCPPPRDGGRGRHSHCRTQVLLSQPRPFTSKIDPTWRIAPCHIAPLNHLQMIILNGVLSLLWYITFGLLLGALTGTYGCKTVLRKHHHTCLNILFCLNVTLALFVSWETV